jgi:hypothetical protein
MMNYYKPYIETQEGIFLMITNCEIINNTIGIPIQQFTSWVLQLVNKMTIVFFIIIVTTSLC